MQRTRITLKNVSDVKRFVTEVTALSYEVDLEQGRYIVDGASIMGIFALDTLSPIDVVAHTDNADEFFAKIKDFIVE
ncbi:MAG: HPr family phosphocarrier protein [Clostridia bacterium]|nr:HPr family phosphocarrier protein [Clostridia bacterium]